MQAFENIGEREWLMKQGREEVEEDGIQSIREWLGLELHQDFPFP